MCYCVYVCVWGGLKHTSLNLFPPAMTDWRQCVQCSLHSFLLLTFKQCSCFCCLQSARGGIHLALYESVLTNEYISEIQYSWDCVHKREDARARRTPRKEPRIMFTPLSRDLSSSTGVFVCAHVAALLIWPENEWMLSFPCLWPDCTSRRKRLNKAMGGKTKSTDEEKSTRQLKWKEILDSLETAESSCEALKKKAIWWKISFSITQCAENIRSSLNPACRYAHHKVSQR